MRTAEIEIKIRTNGAKSTLVDIRKEAVKTYNSLGKLGNVKGLSSLSSKARAASNDINGLSSKANKAQSSLLRFGNNSRKTANDVSYFNSKIKSVPALLEKVGLKSISVGKSLKKVSVAIIAQAGAVIYFARKWENATVNIAKQLPDGVGKNAYKEVLVDIQELAIKSGKTRESLAELVAEAGKAGVEFSNWSDFMKLGAEGAVALDIEAGKLGQTLLGIGAGFGIRNNIPALEQLTKQVNVLADSSKSTADEIFTTSSRIAGLAHQAGLTELQLATMSATLIDTGKSPEIASTGIRSLIVNLSSLKNLTPKATKAIEELGLSPEKLIENFKTNAPLALSEFKKAVDSSGDVVGNLTRIFGRENSSSIAALLGNMGKYNELLAKAGDKSIVAAKWTDELARQQATFDTKLGQVRESLKSLVTVETLDVFKKLLDSVKPMINDFSAWAKENPKLVKSIALIVGGLALLSPALVGAGALIGGLTTTIGLASKAMVGLNFLIRANPIGLLVTGIAALVLYRKELKALVFGTGKAIDINASYAKDLKVVEQATLNVATASNTRVVELRKEITALIDKQKVELQIAKAGVAKSRQQLSAASAPTGFDGIKESPALARRREFLKQDLKYRNQTLAQMGKLTAGLKAYDRVVERAKQTKLSALDVDKKAIVSTVDISNSFKGNKKSIKGVISEYDKLVGSMTEDINNQTLSHLARTKLTSAYIKGTIAEKANLEMLAKKQDALENGKIITKGVIKAQNDLNNSNALLGSGRAKTLVDLEKENLKIGKNELGLYKLTLQQLSYGKDKLKLTTQEIAHRVALKATNIAYKTQFDLMEKGKALVQSAKNKAVDLSFKVGVQDGSLDKKGQRLADDAATLAVERHKMVRDGLNVTYINSTIAATASAQATRRTIDSEEEAANKARSLRDANAEKVIELQREYKQLVLLPEAYERWNNAQKLVKGTTNSAIIALQKQNTHTKNVITTTKGFITALAGGKDTVKTFFKSLIANLIATRIQMALLGKTGGGGGVGGITKFLGFHDGGIIGSGDHSFARSLPKFHTGGIIGSDERLSITQVGEGVFTREQMAALTPVSSTNVNVNIIIEGDASSLVTVKQSSNGDIRIIAREEAKKLIDQEPKFEQEILNPNSSHSQALAQAGFTERRKAG